MLDNLLQTVLCDTQVATMVAQVAVTALMFWVAVKSFLAVQRTTQCEADTVSDLGFAQRAYSEQTERHEKEHTRLLAELKQTEMETERMHKEVELTRQRLRDASQLTRDVIQRNEELADAMDTIAERADACAEFYDARREATERETDELIDGLEEMEADCEEIKCKTDAFHKECVLVAEKLQARLPSEAAATTEQVSAALDAAETEETDGSAATDAEDDDMLLDPALVDGVALEADFQRMQGLNDHLLGEVDRVWNRELEGLRHAITTHGADIGALHAQLELLRHRDELKDTAEDLKQQLISVTEEVAETREALVSESVQRLRAAHEETTASTNVTPAKTGALAEKKSNIFSPAKTPTSAAKEIAGAPAVLSPGGTEIKFCSPSANVVDATA
jgi:hypothetical protein